MTTIGQLTAKKITFDWDEPRGTTQSVHVEIDPGCFVHVGLGHAGLMIYHGKTRVGIPIADLVALAQTHEPSLKPAAVIQAQATAAAATAARLSQEAMQRKLAARTGAPASGTAPEA